MALVIQTFFNPIFRWLHLEATVAMQSHSGVEKLTESRALIDYFEFKGIMPNFAFIS